MNCTCANMSESNIMAYVNNLFTFCKYAYYAKFLFNIDFFCQFFTWTTLNDVNLCFSLNVGKKSQCCRRGNYMGRVITIPTHD